MNNYCTNCGEKLKENAIKCDKCNTYVVDLKSIKKEKIYKIIIISIIIIIIAIIVSVFSYNIYYKIQSKNIYRKYLKEEYQNAEFINYEPCRECDGSCDGGCINSPKIVGCYIYYYKSNPTNKSPDIVVYSNKGKISIDEYNVIVNKYDFYIDKIDNTSFNYETEKRKYLYISAKNKIDSSNIEKTYNMIKELISNYEKDRTLYLEIYIYNKDGNNITVTNEDKNQNTFIWTFDRDIYLINPSLDEVKTIFDQTSIKENTIEGNYNND